MLSLHHLLLLTGVASGALFLIGDVVSGLRLDGAASSADGESDYSFLSNTISELLMPTSPSRPVALFFMVLSDLCGMIFGFVGIRCLVSVRHRVEDPHYCYSSGGRRSIEISGTLLGIAATCNLLSAAIFPQDERGGTSTLAGMLHILLFEGLSRKLDSRRDISCCAIRS